MSQLLLINPIKKGKTIMKKRRTAAQKAATKRMLAANRARRNPAKRRTGTAVTVAPKRRVSRKRNPVGLARIAKRRSIRRRNPISAVSMSGIKGMVKEAAFGGAGALLVNTASNYLPVPAALKMGMGKNAVRAAIAVALGLFGAKVLPRGIAQSMAVGALTVTAHDMMLAAATKAAPTLLLGDIAYYDPENNDNLDGMGAYVDSDMDGMGQYVNQDFSS